MGLILQTIFHTVNLSGSIFSPMHLPVMPMMALELLGYGLMTGLLFRKTKKYTYL